MEAPAAKQSYARRVLVVLLCAVAALLSLHLLLQAVNLEVYHQQHGQFYELANRFDFDDEASVPTWFAQFLYLILSAGAFLAAYMGKNSAVRRLWSLIALFALVFSVDEVAGLHEYVLQTIHVIFYSDALPGTFSNAWLLLLPFLLFGAGIFLYGMARTLPRRTLLLFSLAVVTFLFGAIAIDVIASQVYRETFINQGIIIGLEETLELISLVIVVYAIADYLEREHGKALHSALHQLRS